MNELTPEPQPSTARRLAGAKVYSLTYGCQMNVLDTELALSAVTADGAAIVDDSEQADVVLVNTCSVREHAESKAYSFLGTLKRRKRDNPSLVIAVLGCMAQKDGELIFRRAPYVDIVAGTRHFTRIQDYIVQVREEGRRILALDRDEKVRSEVRSPSSRPDQHSAFVSVMRGCDHHCTYCVVPNTRGVEESRPLDEVARETEILVGGGATEITLLGQNIDSYGKRLAPRRNLADLIRRVAETPGLKRLRFITSHPADIREQLIECFRPDEVPNLMPYFHFPAQSGSDQVLKRMRRGYSAQRYLELVERIREVRPDVGIASDTIVGFCGETDEDFERTLELHRAARYQICYMFAYSERAFTPAVKMSLADDVAREVKKERLQRLIALQREIQEENNAQMIGQTLEVLVVGISRNNPEVYSGRTPQNQLVHFSSGRGDLAGEYCRIRITSASDVALYGDPCDGSDPIQ